MRTPPMRGCPLRCPPPLVLPCRRAAVLPHCRAGVLSCCSAVVFAHFQSLSASACYPPSWTHAPLTLPAYPLHTRSLPPQVRTAGVTPNEVAIDGEEYEREHKRMVEVAEAKRQALFDLQDAIDSMEPEHVARELQRNLKTNVVGSEWVRRGWRVLLLLRSRSLCRCCHTHHASHPPPPPKPHHTHRTRP